MFKVALIVPFRLQTAPLSDTCYSTGASCAAPSVVARTDLSTLRRAENSLRVLLDLRFLHRVEIRSPCNYVMLGPTVLHVIILGPCSTQPAVIRLTFAAITACTCSRSA